MARPKATRRDVEKGDRFEDNDWRQAGRVVQVTEVFTGEDDGKRYARVIVEEHPKNTDAIGHESTVQEFTLQRRYRRISR